MSEVKMTGRKVNKPGCATVRNQATALFSLPMRLGQHVFYEEKVGLLCLSSFGKNARFSQSYYSFPPNKNLLHTLW